MVEDLVILTFGDVDDRIVLAVNEVLGSKGMMGRSNLSFANTACNMNKLR